LSAAELDPTEAWLAHLEQRHLANLTRREVARALSALSSCYVERRGRLAEGGALESAGKRAAFALFYGPLHFLVTRAIVRSLPGFAAPLDEVLDLGCGTGAAGAAWAIASGTPRIRGFDRHPWAVAEATDTYRAFHLDGRARHADLGGGPRRLGFSAMATRGTGVLAAFAANELTAEGRAHLLAELLAAHGRGARVLVIEPIARRALPWWDEWAAAFTGAGGRADEWRFPSALPPLQRSLAKAAGLDPQEMTARSVSSGNPGL
jgi:SAM-dependent methyltransferase